jgi:uncharacterized protein YdhG (YjbR/CyaY superfamily)
MDPLSTQAALMSIPRNAKLPSVSEYMKDLPPQSALVLRKVRTLVRKNVPGCEELISYGSPAFKLGRIFMFCAAFKSHIGIYPPVRDDARLMRQLKPYANAKGNLRFPLSAPMPYPLIARVAKALSKPARRDRKRGS